ncbi:MAG: M48 family metallopeptidase [Anaerolineae bacterium]|nr:M48 family metallopeptidase [Anaerolineae bacterium]
MWILIGLLALRAAIDTALSALNLAHLRRRAADPPGEWADLVDREHYPHVIAYTAARTKLGHAARAADLAVTCAILLTGLLPAVARWASALPIAPAWQGLLVLAVPAAIAYLADLPWDLLSQFGVEARFGFSTITVKTWLLDQLKSLLIAGVLGVLLGGGLLLLIGRLGRVWWLPAWGLLALFQLLIGYVAPVLILPLFNKFEPLEDEVLRDQIEDLARQAAFPLSGIYQVDASLRSTHANAYFIGFGRTRRIALYDTLIEQHTRAEIVAVMAHEIGHWKLRHVLQTTVGAIVASGAGLYLCALLLDLPWLYGAMGAGELYARLRPVGPAAAVGLYAIEVLLSPLGLLLAPIATWISRRNEYQADAYALTLYPHPGALENALVKLSDKNLSNLFPHPLVVAFRYSHPPLIERVRAIRARANAGGARPAGT